MTTQQIEEEEYEEEAKKMAETAHELAEKFERERQIPNEETVVELPVVSANRDNRELVFTVLLGADEKREVTVPWPDDTQDMSEPLVRLVNWKGVTFKTFTQIDTVPVYTDGDDDTYELCVPEDGSELQDIPILYDYHIEQQNFSNYVAAKPKSIVTVPVATLCLALATGITATVGGLSELSTVSGFDVGFVAFTAVFILAGVGLNLLYRTVRNIMS